jgi:hypothetical protein
MTDERVKYDANDETTDIDGQVRWRYVIGHDAKDPDPDVSKRRALEVNLSKPSQEQLLVLLRLVDLAEDDEVSTVRLYGDAIDALMAPGESLRCQRWLLRGRVTAEEFGRVAPAAVEHFWPEVMAEARAKAPKHGPTARPRRARR